MRKPDRPRWTTWDCIKVLVLVLAGSYGVLLLLTPWWEKTALGQSKGVRFLLHTIIQAGLIFSGVTYTVRYRYRQDWATLGLHGRNLGRAFSHGTGGGFFLFLLVLGMGIILEQLLPVEPKPQPFARLVMEARNWQQLIIPFLIGSVIAPFAEELYFRGFLYPALRVKWGIRWAVFLSALIFGSLHLDPVRLIPLAVGGAGLAWIYEISGSLVAPIIAHALWNTIMLVVLYLSTTV
ncbi:CPBP family intramembrane glutamic endopeptidase [Calderihabitans maritimus]|uniref:Abortive infection protein n=1 Tax=Calderihabitans maritimus TaxID=1246530 RepID=A0A1Z5HPW0_9FIRM|nr:CPBP family intramembrane glutamic endopeptidase [Calderihabitans maritimus]GAW91576.1 abortive infection protein [Calderihabitans maritimus]